jgi:hypothetical protein
VQWCAGSATGVTEALADGDGLAVLLGVVLGGPAALGRPGRPALVPLPGKLSAALLLTSHPCCPPG